MVWAPAYVTDVELKKFVTVDDVTDDAEVGLAIEAASRAVDDATGRQFGKVAAPETRKYTALCRGGRWVVEIDDLMTTVGLVVSVPAGTITAYTLTPVNAATEGRPWTRLVVDTASTIQPTGAPYEVTATATWGWTAIPGAVKQATMLQANRFLQRRNSPYGVAGSPSDGSELRLLARVDPDVAVILGPFVKRRFVFA